MALSGFRATGLGAFLAACADPVPRALSRSTFARSLDVEDGGIAPGPLIAGMLLGKAVAFEDLPVDCFGCRAAALKLIPANIATANKDLISAPQFETART